MKRREMNDKKEKEMKMSEYGMKDKDYEKDYEN